jgi:hypothetical protein
MRTIISAVLIALTLQSPSSDPWANMRFIVGNWDGVVNGRPGNGTVSRTYNFVLGNKFVQVRNKSTYPPQEKNPKGEVHEDWGFISYDSARKKLILRQFHVEGFVNQYVLQSESPSEVVFVSEAIENIPSGWRARETYRRLGPDEFVERFDLAEPGKNFELYSETRFRRSK